MALTVLLDAWAAAMWRASWQGGLVVLVVWSICRINPSMPARYQCWFWRLAILKFLMVLLCPTLLHLPLLPAPPVPAPFPEVGLQVTTDMPEMPVGRVDQVESNQREAIELPSLPTILGFAWVIGAGWSSAWLLVAWHRARKLQKQSRTIDGVPLIEQLAVQGRLFGLRNLPRLVEVKGSGSPMLIGTFHPAIVFPTHTLGRLSISERTMVLGHELAHIRRGDLLWGLIASIVRAVFFFHPLAWWSERQLKLAQEVAADQLVIARQHHEPVNYASLLVSVVGKLGSRPSVSTISVETAGTIHSLTRRLAAMTCIGQTSRRVVVSSAVLLITTVLLGLVPWRLVAAEPKEDEPAPSSVAEKSAEGTVGPLPEVRLDADPKDGTEQAKATAEIEKLGGKVIVDEKNPAKPVIGVDLTGTKVTDAGLEHLKGLPKLQSLKLYRTKVTDEGLKHLKGLTNLQSLALEETGVTDEGLEHLQGLPKLQSLKLYRTKVTDEGLKHLKGLTNLQSLALEESGVTDEGLEHLQGLPKLQSLKLYRTKVTDEGLKHLKGLPRLRSLDLEECGVTDAGLANLTALTNLRSLKLYRTKVTDRGLEHIKGLTSLRSLDLEECKVTNQGLERIKGLTNLQSLKLYRTKVTDEGLKHLKGVTHLRSLALEDCGVTGAGLEHLKGLPKLQSLKLYHTKVTDEGLKHLKGLPHLRSLALEECGVTDAGLANLEGFSNLQSLRFWATKVTDEGVKKLQKALPNCKISHGNAPYQRQVPAPGTKSSGPSDRSSPATGIAKRASAWAAEVNAEQAKAVAEIVKLGGKVAFNEMGPGKPGICVNFWIVEGIYG
jgi:beta-lactamase regulating signal transducer with metallopeptidase domain/Leucine-rich repeat (LRR) protein